MPAECGTDQSNDRLAIANFSVLHISPVFVYNGTQVKTPMFRYVQFIIFSAYA